MILILFFSPLMWGNGWGKSLDYQVRQGENYARIAIKLKIAYDDLVASNKGKKNLKMGDIIKLPPYEYTKIDSEKRLVQWSQENKVKIKVLEELNGKIRPNLRGVIRTGRRSDISKTQGQSTVQKIVMTKDPPKGKNASIEMLDEDKPEKPPEVKKESKAFIELKGTSPFVVTPSKSNLFREERYERMLDSMHFSWPVKGEIQGVYGELGSIMQYGLAIQPEDRHVLASEKGIVKFVDIVRGMGLVIVVLHDNGIFSLYHGKMTPLIKVGDSVSSGEPIAETTGNVTFSFFDDGYPLNPFRLLLR